MARADLTDAEWIEIRNGIEAGSLSFSAAQRRYQGRVTRQGIRFRANKEGWNLPSPRASALPSDVSTLLLSADGRSKLSSELLAAILSDIEIGLSETKACHANDLRPETFSDWRQAFPDIDQLVKRAKAKFERARITGISSSTDWRAHANLLANSPHTRDEWGRNEADDKTGFVVQIAVGQPRQLNVGDTVTIDEGQAELLSRET